MTSGDARPLARNHRQRGGASGAYSRSTIRTLALRVLEDERDHRRVEPGVDRIEYRASHRHAIVRLEHRRRIRQQHGHGVAVADVARGQRRGQPAAAIAENCRQLSAQVAVDTAGWSGKTSAAQAIRLSGVRARGWRPGATGPRDKGLAKWAWLPLFRQAMASMNEGTDYDGGPLSLALAGEARDAHAVAASRFRCRRPAAPARRDVAGLRPSRRDARPEAVQSCGTPGCTRRLGPVRPRPCRAASPTSRSS